MEQLTVKEAIEQGYERAGRDGLEFQHLVPLEDFERHPDLFEDGWLLANKESFTASIDEDTLFDMVLNELQNNEEIYDDTNAIRDSLSKVDMKSIAKTINDQIEQDVKYWHLTKIKLVP